MLTAARAGLPTTAPTPTSHLLTVAEVATMTLLSKSSIYRLIRVGELPAVRVGHSVRISSVDVRRLAGAAPISSP
jgi:excisionase family DNA binding protein